MEDINAAVDSVGWWILGWIYELTVRTTIGNPELCRAVSFYPFQICQGMQGGKTARETLFSLCGSQVTSFALGDDCESCSTPAPFNPFFDLLPNSIFSMTVASEDEELEASPLGLSVVITVGKDGVVKLQLIIRGKIND